VATALFHNSASVVTDLAMPTKSIRFVLPVNQALAKGRVGNGEDQRSAGNRNVLSIGQNVCFQRVKIFEVLALMKEVLISSFTDDHQIIYIEKTHLVIY